jgi:hypothetical protein
MPVVTQLTAHIPTDVYKVHLTSSLFVCWAERAHPLRCLRTIPVVYRFGSSVVSHISSRIMVLESPGLLSEHRRFNWLLDSPWLTWQEKLARVKFEIHQPEAMCKLELTSPARLSARAQLSSHPSYQFTRRYYFSHVILRSQLKTRYF